MENDLKVQNKDSVARKGSAYYMLLNIFSSKVRVRMKSRLNGSKSIAHEQCNSKNATSRPRLTGSINYECINTKMYCLCACIQDWSTYIHIAAYQTRVGWGKRERRKEWEGKKKFLAHTKKGQSKNYSSSSGSSNRISSFKLARAEESLEQVWGCWPPFLRRLFFVLIPGPEQEAIISVSSYLPGRQTGERSSFSYAVCCINIYIYSRWEICTELSKLGFGCERRMVCPYLCPCIVTW